MIWGINLIFGDLDPQGKVEKRASRKCLRVFNLLFRSR